jgi:hypothetical protein
MERRLMPLDMLTWRSSGTVRKTRAGAIRWTSFSIYHGEERWRSEGVQIGGLRSARGVLGTWFDKYVSFRLPHLTAISLSTSIYNSRLP